MFVISKCLCTYNMYYLYVVREEGPNLGPINNITLFLGVWFSCKIRICLRQVAYVFIIGKIVLKKKILQWIYKHTHT